MAKISPNDLNFGHFGQPIYNLDNNAWIFKRNPGKRNELRQLGSWKTVLPAAERFGDITPPEQTRRIRETQQAAKDLSRSEPVLTPSIGLLSELEAASAAIASVTRTYDPTVGDLMSFGSITTSGRKRRSKFVAAIAAGEGGTILRLVTLAKERQGWETDKGIWIEGLSMVDEDSGYWAEDAAPLQQLCFAESDNRSVFLAARFPTKTAILRPHHYESDKPPRRSPYYELPSSKIDPRPVISIDILQTGGIPHAHVAFNPDYQRQVGIVDQAGGWSIWDIEGGSRGESQTSIICSARGSISLPRVEIAEEEPHARQDGWARIMWVGDVNTVVVCNRRYLNAIDIKGDQPTPLPCVATIPKHSADWILDLKRHAQERHRFYVLTSSRLFLLEIKCLNDALENGGDRAGVVILLSWVHFRGLDDISMGLSIPTGLEEGSSLVLLYSRLNSLLTVFQFRGHELEPTIPISGSDPIDLDFHGSLQNSTNNLQRISSIYVDRMTFRESDRVKPSGIGSIYLSDGVCFYRATVVLSDLSVREALLFSIPQASEGCFVEPPSWTTMIYPPRPEPSATVVTEEDDFIVPDGLDATSRLRTPYRRLKWSEMRRVDKSHADTSDDLCTEDFSSVYDALLPQNAAQTDNKDHWNSSKELSVIIDRLQDLLLENSGLEEISCSTMFDIVKSDIVVSDIDAASSKLQNLLATEQVSDTFQFRRITSGENWIAPLPQEIPVRARQSKERLARLIAAKVVLAGICFHQQVVPDAEASALQQTGPSQAGGVLLSNLLSTSPQEREPPQIPSSPAWPQGYLPSFPTLNPALPKPELIPSVTSGSIYTPSLPATSNLTASPIGRLSERLQISKPPTTIPLSVSQVLMHWHSGTDPGAYDWGQTTRAVQGELDEGDELSAARRHKLQRKADRHLKRQRREAEAMRKAESQPQFGREGGPRSSPPPIVGLGMNSQVGSQSRSRGQATSILGSGIVQSQVEPGRHGGRAKLLKIDPRRLQPSTHSIAAVNSTQLILYVRIPEPAARLHGPRRHRCTAACRRTVGPNVSYRGPSAEWRRARRRQLLPDRDRNGSSANSRGTRAWKAWLSVETLGLMNMNRHGTGYDYIHNDVDGLHMRLDVRSQVRNKDGTLFAMYYKGTVGLTPGVKAILGGGDDAKTTEYGDSFVTFSFETGKVEYKGLENGTYVGAGHFVKEEGKKGVIVEYKVSRVVYKK
ncbi:hypothetical protein CC78DRAFT_570583 [Lojkania enalia]|uniref:Uncharacterized protein n=1 Tax=Lojkania enalia TaxID=147567 RepID=A0A9P4N0G5_9PLEO|nr:hypothetical protein CC78DRAFT_570583 [Didymosphaeria enalia]